MANLVAEKQYNDITVFGVNLKVEQFFTYVAINLDPHGRAIVNAFYYTPKVYRGSMFTQGHQWKSDKESGGVWIATLSGLTLEEEEQTKTLIIPNIDQVEC